MLLPCPLANYHFQVLEQLGWFYRRTVGGAGLAVRSTHGATPPQNRQQNPDFAQVLMHFCRGAGRDYAGFGVLEIMVVKRHKLLSHASLESQLAMHASRAMLTIP
jgi:hypothetical protein